MANLNNEPKLAVLGHRPSSTMSTLHVGASDPSSSSLLHHTGWFCFHGSTVPELAAWSTLSSLIFLFLSLFHALKLLDFLCDS